MGKPESTGAKGFEDRYWESLFADPESMECIGNAALHADYLVAALAVESVSVRNIVGLGIGMGRLFAEVLRRYRPRRALGLEPSAWAWARLNIEELKPTKSTNLRLLRQDLLTWCQRDTPGWNRFELGLCTSVLQYLSETEINHIMPVLAQRIEHLYLTVPTDHELAIQEEENGLRDEWAHSRSAEWYRARIQPHFAVVSGRMLQSRVLFDWRSSPFTDLLYRF